LRTPEIRRSKNAKKWEFWFNKKGPCVNLLQGKLKECGKKWGGEKTAVQKKSRGACKTGFTILKMEGVVHHGF